MRVLLYREETFGVELKYSQLYDVHINRKGSYHVTSLSYPASPSPIKYFGWEKTLNGALGPRLVNLSSSLDPVKLAEAAVDLNIQLMKWRIMPSLNREEISALKCLIVGSGTLGCAVARTLMVFLNTCIFDYLGLGCAKY